MESKSKNLSKLFRTQLNDAIEKNKMQTSDDGYFRGIYFNGQYFLIEWWLKENCLNYHLLCEAYITPEICFVFDEPTYTMSEQKIDSEIEIPDHVEKIMNAIKTSNVGDNIKIIFDIAKKSMMSLNNCEGFKDGNQQIFIEALRKCGLKI
jgi:hypothetical protein